MAAARGRTRAKWIAVLCALAAVVVGIAGLREGTRFFRESRAMAALASKDEAKRRAALRELGELRSVRAVPAILGTMASDGKVSMSMGIRMDQVRNTGAGKVVSSPLGDNSWEVLCDAAVREIGTAAIPILRSRLASPSSPERFWSLFFLLRIIDVVPREPDPAVLSLLDDPDSDVTVMASYMVGFSAARNPGLLESLVADLNRVDASEGLRLSAAMSLEIAANPVESAAGFGLAKGDASFGGDLVSPEMKAGVRSAVLALLGAAEEFSEDLRFLSRKALTTIRRQWSFEDLDLEAGIRGIIRRGLSQDYGSRREEALSWISDVYDPEAGTIPIDVLETLGGLLGNEEAAKDEEDDRGQVQRLTRFYLTHPRAIPVLLRVLTTNDSSASSQAMQILDALGERDDPEVRQEVLTGFSQALAPKEPGIRRAAVRVLARYHESSPQDIVPLLSPLLLDEDEEVFAHAALALSSSGDLAGEVFDTRVLELLDPARPLPLRVSACAAAKNLGPEARKAVPALVAASKASSPELVTAAVEALAVVSPEESLPLFMGALSHESPGVRDAAVTALWTLGSAATPALPALRKLAKDEKDLDLATRATTLVRRLEAEEGRSSRGPR